MLKRTIKFIMSSAGIYIVGLCWIFAFISFILLLSIDETENNIRTLFLPNNYQNVFQNYQNKDKRLEINSMLKDEFQMDMIEDIVQPPEEIENNNSDNAENIVDNTNDLYKPEETTTNEITETKKRDNDNKELQLKFSRSESGLKSKEEYSRNSNIKTEEPLFLTIYPMLNESDAPGENAKPYTIENSKLSPPEKLEYESGWHNHEFNLFASDRISVRRSIPDRRSDICKKETHSKNMTSTSIIIVFHNEAWSTLLRTVHSIIDRSPKELLEEIILVDDASTMAHLGRPLDSYMKLLEKVKIKRTKTRSGLMKARIIGADIAKGDILTFLDAHIECYPGWLEPLLSRIADNDTNVVCPVIDAISEDSFEPTFLNDNNMAVGVFDWSMQFNWKFPSQINRKIKNLGDPIRSPTMAGGLFSIKKSYFYHLGTYDSGMKIWGSENIEISFRIWMCGGTLEIIPCSHVGHIFRKRSPYNWGENINKILTVNQRRLVEVWLEDYKEIYYMITGNRNKFNIGDISSRLDLKNRLKCKSFQWYLNNIYPELFNPLESRFVGTIQSLSSRDKCIDGGSSTSQNPILYPCHNDGGNQIWFLNKDGYLRNIKSCILGPQFSILPCGNSKLNGWIYKQNESIITDDKGSCLTVVDLKLTVTKCSTTKPDINQKWNLKSLYTFKLKPQIST